jgi:PAS domain-containing protein
MFTPHELSRHVERLLNSYRHWIGSELIVRGASAADDAALLDHAPCIVVSHGTEPDPLLNYGNRAALELWEITLEQFCTLPSRQTAEPMHREERARLLERTTLHGYVDDYQGIRISSTGRRFRIHRATVWNLLDEAGLLCGQAATFHDYEYLS